jgi:ParB/RepB/Spo0J family partition protein
MKIEKIDIGSIKVDTEQNARKDPGDIEALKESIKSIGLQQPLVVRKTKKGYMLVAGFRRMKCLQELEINTVYCVVHNTKMTVAEALLTNLAENVPRHSLNPMEEAEAVQRLMDNGIDRQRIQSTCGWTPQLLAQRLHLLKIGEVLQKAIREGEISTYQAFAINRLPKDEQDEHLKVAGKTSQRELLRIIEKRLAQIKEAKQAEAQQIKVPGTIPEKVEPKEEPKDQRKEIQISDKPTPPPKPEVPEQGKKDTKAKVEKQSVQKVKEEKPTEAPSKRKDPREKMIQETQSSFESLVTFCSDGEFEPIDFGFISFQYVEIFHQVFEDIGQAFDKLNDYIHKNHKEYKRGIVDILWPEEEVSEAEKPEDEDV